MDCDGLRDVLFDHVDGLLGREEADAARDHLGACGSCRALQEEVRRNFSALDAWEEEELPAGAFGRLEARIAGAPSSPSVPSSVSAPSPGNPASAGVPSRRSWIRIAVSYGAGLATAAAFLWVFVLPHSPPRSGGDPVVPAWVGDTEAITGPTVGTVAYEAGDLVTPAPVSRFSGAAGSLAAGGSSLRFGERPLEFRDADQGVLRRFRLPPGVDPGKVLLVDTRPRILQDDEGVK